MCGIAGVAWKDVARRSPAGLVERMTERIRVRGPDGDGHVHFEGCSLGHRRLSIIDLETGAQPMSNEDDSIWVTFNGEVYNFGELRERLIGEGHVFKTSSDTETLVHLYESMGDRMPTALRGMFAFAIWDRPRRRLFFARDRLGVKPFVYWNAADGFYFASELKSFVAEPDFPREIDQTALADYLAYQYVPHPKTIFKAAAKLPPAHYGVYLEGRLSIDRYWSPPFDEESTVDEPTYLAELKREIVEATRLRMISDVPIGAFLSGGVDSSIVAGVMQSLADRPIDTFSIGFPIKEYDESHYADEVARHLGTNHHHLIVEPKACDVVDELSVRFDEPFADSSAIPTYYVSKMTRESATVALSGDGGDELFCGYDRYRAVRIGEVFDRLPSPVKSLVGSKVWQRMPSSSRQKSRVRRLKKVLLHLRESPQARYLRNLRIFDDDRLDALWAPEFAATLEGYRPNDRIDRLFERFPGRDMVTRATAVDVESYLPCDILPKVDVASMSASLECRGPFLDWKVVELAARMPIGMKLKGTTTKSALRRCFPEYLPPRIMRRPKMGFGVPIGEWFRGELRDRLDDTLSREAVKRRGWISFDQVARLRAEHDARRWDHSARLWALFMLERWARSYLD